VAPRFERFGARTRGALVDSASRGVGSLYGLRVVEVARRLAPHGRHRPPVAPVEVAERSRWRTSSEGRRPLPGRVPARSSSERDLGGDQKPMEDRASRDQQWARRRYGLVDGARPRSPPSLAIPPKRRQRRLRSACERANRERSRFRSQPLRRRSERERKRQGGNGRGDAVRL